MTRCLIFLSILCLISCREQPYLESKLELAEDAWSHDKSYDYPFEIQDTIAQYDLELDLEFSKEFKYQNLYIELTTFFPKGNEVNDVLSLQLTDEFADWIGDCNAKSCTAKFQLQKNIRFKELGDYKLGIRQHSRVNDLEGVKAITFRIIKLKN